MSFRVHGHQTKSCCLCGRLTNPFDRANWTTGFAMTSADLCPACSKKFGLLEEGYSPKTHAQKLAFDIAISIETLREKLIGMQAVLCELDQDLLRDPYLLSKVWELSDAIKFHFTPLGNNDTTKDTEDGEE